MLLDPIKPPSFFSFGRMELPFDPDLDSSTVQNTTNGRRNQQINNTSCTKERAQGSNAVAPHPQAVARDERASMLIKAADPDPIDPSACRVVQHLPFSQLLGQTEQQRLSHLNEFRDMFYRDPSSSRQSERQYNPPKAHCNPPNPSNHVSYPIEAMHPPQQGSFSDVEFSTMVFRLPQQLTGGNRQPGLKPIPEARAVSQSNTGTDGTSSSQSQGSSIRRPPEEKSDSPAQQDRWDERFEELRHFVREHGHCHVPTRLESNPSLARWCKRQRYQYKLKCAGEHSTLTEEREEKLNDLDFVWDVHSSSWEERFLELVAFKMKYGHANVPRSRGKLGSWVKSQRRQHSLYIRGEKSHLTPERVAKMNSLGFEWVGSKSPLPRDIGYGQEDSS